MIRFLNLGTITPECSVVVERVLFQGHRYSGDTVCIYFRDRPCVSVGRFRDPSLTIDVDAAKADGITFVERMSGGSAIFYDTGQLTYSVVLGRSRLSGEREERFRTICNCLVHSLELLGVDASYKPVNDILANGRKISGSAQYRDDETVLQHGSLLIDADLSRTERYLVDPENKKYDGLTTVKECLGRVPAMQEIEDAVMRGFSEGLGEELISGGLLDHERSRIRNMCDESH